MSESSFDVCYVLADQNMKLENCLSVGVIVSSPRNFHLFHCSLEWNYLQTYFEPFTDSHCSHVHNLSVSRVSFKFQAMALVFRFEGVLPVKRRPRCGVHSDVWTILQATRCNVSYKTHENSMSRLMTKATTWHVRPAKTWISLAIRTVWSEPSLSTWRKLGSLATHWAPSDAYHQTDGCPGWCESSLGAQSFCFFCCFFLCVFFFMRRLMHFGITNCKCTETLHDRIMHSVWFIFLIRYE